MSQAAISFRGDETLKRSFDSVCDQLGLSNSAAYTLFMKAVVRERRIPFEVKIDSDEEIRNKAIQAVARMRAATAESGMTDMPLDEINSIIDDVRNGR